MVTYDRKEITRYDNNKINRRNVLSWVTDTRNHNHPWTLDLSFKRASYKEIHQDIAYDWKGFGADTIAVIGFIYRFLVAQIHSAFKRMITQMKKENFFKKLKLWIS